VSAGVDYIVTGDKDVLRFDVYNVIRILNPSDFLGVVTQR
jgi:predicted nucleic acid-binding protein